MITKKAIQELAESDQVIPLIKEFRAVSGMGLKESKDAIEACRKGRSSTFDITKEFDIEKLQATFAPYLKTPEELEQYRKEQEAFQAEQDRLYREKQEQEKRQKQEEMRSLMLQGVHIAFDHFKQLGFNNPFDAVRLTISNFEDKWEY